MLDDPDPGALLAHAEASARRARPPPDTTDPQHLRDASDKALAETLVQAMRTPPPLPSLRPVRFARTGDARLPYEAELDGARWTVRVNEFPAEPSVYSLLVDGVVVEELMAWPAAWSRPDE